MSPSRPEMLFKAQISEKAERYDDMVKWITEVVSESGGSGLSLEERNLLSVAYKNAVGQRRLSWRMVKQLEAKQKKRNNTAAENASADYRRGIETEISNLCNKLLGLLTTSLISTAKEPEDFVFYKKLYGDYNRYLAEFSDGQGRKDAIYNAGKSYDFKSQCVPIATHCTAYTATTYCTAYTATTYCTAYTATTYCTAYTATTYCTAYTATTYCTAYTATTYCTAYTATTYCTAYTATTYCTAYTAT
eukprot:Lankesteria_metandrocarpae@DN3287_c0_g1_i3.p1